MHWQYRTVLFEFRKDGLLGDRYIDEEEMEKVLNDFGGKGWELVSVTPVQEGLLAFFKRAAVQRVTPTATKRATPDESATPDMASSGQPVAAKKGSPEKGSVAAAEKQAEKKGRQADKVGTIKIS